MSMYMHRMSHFRSAGNHRRWLHVQLRDCAAAPMRRVRHKRAVARRKHVQAVADGDGAGEDTAEADEDGVGGGAG